MAAEYTPPYTNLAVLLQDIGLKVRSIYYGEPELYGLPEEITVPEFWDQYNNFHVKIRYDENGEKMKTPIEFNARFIIEGISIVGANQLVNDPKMFYEVTMIKDDGTPFTFRDVFLRNYEKNAWYYPIRYKEDVEKWLSKPINPVPGEFMKYKYPDVITSAELENGVTYIVKIRDKFLFVGKMYARDAIDDKFIFELLYPDPETISKSYEIINIKGVPYININNHRFNAFFPVDTIADEFRNPEKRSAVLQALAGAERNTMTDPNLPLLPGLPADIVRKIATEYGGYKRSNSYKRSNKKQTNKKKSKKHFTKRRR